jgi:nucleoside-diphosphate-sugar epimerase
MSISAAGKQTVLVVGGGEFIDTRLTQALSASALYHPILLRTHAELAASLPQAAMVVNCVAVRPRTIVAVTQALCEAARRNPPLRIVHLSSMAVYGAATGVVDEATEPKEPLNDYARARIEAETLVLKYVADGGDAVIIRPSCMFGPGSEPWVNRIARLLLSRRLGDLGPLGDGICNLIHVDDLAAIIILALSATNVTGEIFNANADWPRPTWNEFLIRFAHAIGATPIRRISALRLRGEVKLVAPLLRGAALAASRVGAGNIVPDALTPTFVRTLQQDINVNSAKASARLGIRYQSLDEMIFEAAQWWRAQQAPPSPAVNAAYSDKTSS